MRKQRPEVYKWLEANLGKNCLAPLTSTDAKALLASVAIIELYSYDRDEDVLDAFMHVVSRMQSHTCELAYHSIAHVMCWEDRSRLWLEAGLPSFNPRICAFEPGGKAVS